MKILHTVEQYWPSVGGAQEVVRQLSEHMAKAGHDVTVATSKLPQRKRLTLNGVKIKQFEVAGKAATGITGEVEAYQKFLTSGKFDIVMNYAAQQWATDLTFPVLSKIKAGKIIVPCGYSAFYSPAFEQYFHDLPAFLRQYDASVYLSNNYRDINFAKHHELKNIHVIPNGADEAEFAELKDESDFRGHYGIGGFMILTVGSHTGIKGHAEVLEVFKRFPLPATLVIIGNEGECSMTCQQMANTINSSQGFSGKRVLVLDLSRSDTVAAFKTADVFLFLSNVEASPLVLFEAAAAGLPFLTSAAGNAAEIVNWTGGGVLTKTVQGERPGFVSAAIWPTVRQLVVLRLNPAYRKRLGRAGRRSFLKRFNWQAVSQQYLKLYEEVAR